jgi:hypothetical protein
MPVPADDTHEEIHMSGYDGNGPTVIIDGEALTRLLQSIKLMDEADTPVTKISVDRRARGVALKINEAMWSSTLPTDTEQQVG